MEDVIISNSDFGSAVNKVYGSKSFWRVFGKSHISKVEQNKLESRLRDLIFESDNKVSFSTALLRLKSKAKNKEFKDLIDILISDFRNLDERNFVKSAFFRNYIKKDRHLSELIQRVESSSNLFVRLHDKTSFNIFLSDYNNFNSFINEKIKSYDFIHNLKGKELSSEHNALLEFFSRSITYNFNLDSSVKKFLSDFKFDKSGKFQSISKNAFPSLLLFVLMYGFNLLFSNGFSMVVKKPGEKLSGAAIVSILILNILILFLFYTPLFGLVDLSVTYITTHMDITLYLLKVIITFYVLLWPMRHLKDVLRAEMTE